MTEEIKQEKCRCVEKFLLITLAAFIGSLVALCLFTAAVKPPVKPCPCPMPHQRFEAPAPYGVEAGRPQPRGEFRQEGKKKLHNMDAPDIKGPKAPEAPKAQR